MRALHWLSLGVLTVAIVIGARYLVQRQEQTTVQLEQLELLRQFLV